MARARDLSMQLRTPRGTGGAGARAARPMSAAGGGLGPVAGKVWRIGCMGHTARIRNVTLLLAALDEILD